MLDEAVILLGGMGTRLLPYTKTVSKEMLPILDVPAIFLLVKEAYLSGIRKIIFVVTEHNKHLIKHFFSDDNYLNNFLKDKPDKRKMLNEIDEIIKKMEFIYVMQELKGSYGALYSCRNYIKNDHFIVMFGDDLVDSDIPLSQKLINEFKINHCMQLACFKKKNSELPDSGIVKIDSNNNLIDLVDKEKANTRLELHGRMLLSKEVFTIKDTLSKHFNDEYYLPHALLRFKNVKVYEYSGKYFNLGERLGYIKASIHYAMKKKEYKEELLEFIKNMKEE